MNSTADIRFTPMMGFVVLFSFGILSAYYFPVPFPVVGCGALSLGSVACGVCCMRSRRLGKLLPSLFFCFSVIVFGAMTMSRTMKRGFVDTSGSMVEYEAVATSRPVQRGKTVRFDALVTSIGGESVKPFKARITVAEPRFPISVGSGLSCFAAFRQPHSYKSSNFDYPRYLATQGFRAESFVYGSNVGGCTINRHRLSRLQLLMLRLAVVRERIVERYSDLGIDGDQLAVMSALTLGDKSMLTPSLRDTYSQSGASHVLALSGLHLGIIYTLLLLLLWRSNRFLLWQLFVRFVVLLTIWGYVLLVGMPLSAVRSALMISVCSVVMLSRRSHLPLNSLAIAATVVLLVSPMSIFDVGFQMSFAAVASIILFPPTLYALFPSRLLESSSLLRWAVGILVVSVAAQMGTAPLAAYYFGRFSSLFFITNFIAVPIAVVLLYGSVLLMVGSLFSGLQAFTALFLNHTVRLLNAALDFIAHLPGASIEGIRLSFLQVVLVYVVIASLFFLLRKIVSCKRMPTSNYIYPDM